MAREDQLFNIEEAAAYLGVTASWMRQLRWSGRGPISWLEMFDGRRRVVYPRSQLDAYQVRRRQRSTRGDGVVSA